jgi:hypothetical protein
MKPEFSQQILEKCLTTKCQEIDAVEDKLFHARGLTHGRAGEQRHEANSCFWQFCERAKKPPPIRIIFVCLCQ